MGIGSSSLSGRVTLHQGNFLWCKSYFIGRLDQDAGRVSRVKIVAESLGWN